MKKENDYELNTKIKNSGLGDCFILKKSNYYYLVYCPFNRSEPFVICDTIMSDGYLGRAMYYCDLEEVLEDFKKMSLKENSYE